MGHLASRRLIRTRQLKLGRGARLRLERATTGTQFVELQRKSASTRRITLRTSSLNLFSWSQVVLRPIGAVSGRAGLNRAVTEARAVAVQSAGSGGNRKLKEAR